MRSVQLACAGEREGVSKNEASILAQAPLEPRTARMAGTSFRDSKGVYSWKNETYPSVTTILKVKDKPALPRWASKSVAEFVAAKCLVMERGEMKGPELLTLLKDVDEIKQVPWKYAEKKRDMGSTFHSVAEQITLGNPVSPDAFSEDVRGYIVSFLRWIESTGAVFEANEFMCVSRKYGYAGTCDGLVKFPARDGLTMIDFKTGKDSYSEHALQLAAYRNADFIAMQSGEEIPMPPTEAALVVLPKDDGSGCRLIEWETGEKEMTAFLGLIAVYQWESGKPKQKEVYL